MDSSNKLSPLLKTSSDVRRQDWDPYYSVNGAIYINAINKLNRFTSLNDNEYGYEMGKEYDLDIDEYFDLLMFEALLERFQS
jgi:CMP-N-acetylneuraminic acid synthetase